MKCEFIDFLNYAIILDPIKGCRTNAGICGSSIGPTLLVAFCVKAISIDIITGVWQDPIGTTIGNLSQLGTHRRIILGLQVEVWWFVILFARTRNFKCLTSMRICYTLCLNQEMKSGALCPAPDLRRVSTSCGVGTLRRRQNCWVNSLYKREVKGVGCRIVNTRGNSLLRTYCMYGSTSTRLVNTYIMIVRNSSLSKALGVTPLALPSCPLKRLRFISFSASF